MEALPLRTGRTNCVTNMQQDMVEQTSKTLAIIASMMQQAAHDATLYCAEARRTVILPRDIELALKRLVLPGSAYWSRDNLPEEAQQIRHRLFVSRQCSANGVKPFFREFSVPWAVTRFRCHSGQFINWPGCPCSHPWHCL
eukprot:COSAG01_NODE_151_length_23939_cov_24.482802_1_plen_141_part_00